MGSPIAPIVADIFISKLEEKLCRFTTNKPRIWYRYVDDILCIFNSEQNITDFLSHINKWHPNIKFTIEWEKHNILSFLDLLIIRQNNKYVATVYRKPTTTNLYLFYDSNQPRKYKLGLIKSLYLRYGVAAGMCHKSPSAKYFKKLVKVSEIKSFLSNKTS